MAVTWDKFGKQYGPLTFLNVAGQPFLVLNSLEVARDILDTRGAIYVDRPRFVMGVELVGMRSFTPFSPFGAEWRGHRTLLKHALSKEVVVRDYSTLLAKKAKQYVECLLVRPDNFLVDLVRITGENIVELSYGRLGDEQGRDYVKLNRRVLDVVNVVFGGYMVDLIPALQYIPSWLPGMKFKRDASKWKKEIDDINRITFERAKQSITSGGLDCKSCFMVNNLLELQGQQESSEDAERMEAQEEIIRHSGFSFFLAGADTSSRTIHAFLLAMTVFPSIQEKACAEIDRVVGSERLPTLDDFNDMPYLHAVVLENFRWCPQSSGGESRFPHRSIEDDVYEGYFIPKGTTVLPNVWGISRNTKHYANPSVFDPERYLGPTPELDPREIIFGFGRRRCPGDELAFRIIWLMAASILWAFRLKRVEGDTTPLNNDSDWFDINTLWFVADHFPPEPCNRGKG
ncbi:hypothetical protein FRC04_009966 [Tulasnella sp. 424]|nr:hypothetical protein FRC04_009966 [Tulasnella sp. 424]